MLVLQKMKGVVAVTGASGFIGSFVVLALREAGYQVRACVRDPANKEKVGHLQNLVGVELFAADLFQEGSYTKAFAGADAVVHCAAVVEIARVKDPQREVVDPSVKGVKNVLACLGPSVKTLVHTSSIGAIHQRNREGNVLTEADWNEWATIANDPYGYAKTQAEKVVWEWAKNAGRGVAIRVMNPTVVLGPVQCKLHTKSSTVFCREAVYNNKVREEKQRRLCVTFERLFRFGRAMSMCATWLLLTCGLWSCRAKRTAECSASFSRLTRRLFRPTASAALLSGSCRSTCCALRPAIRPGSSGSWSFCHTSLALSF